MALLARPWSWSSSNSNGASTRSRQRERRNKSLRIRTSLVFVYLCFSLLHVSILPLSLFVSYGLFLLLYFPRSFGLSLIATPAAVVQATSVSGLFRGLVMSCGREGVFTAGYMGLGPSVAKVPVEIRGWLKAFVGS